MADKPTTVARIEAPRLAAPLSEPPGQRPAWPFTMRRPILKDAPGFGGPINAALVVIDGAHTLVWARSGSPRGD